jgi:uncharacterized protein
MQSLSVIQYELGALCWVGLATSEPTAAKTFYERVFGWQSEDLAAGEAGLYTSLRRDGTEVAILYRQTREARAARAAPHWTPYIAVEDADRTALRACELGGALLREPHDLAGAGRVAAVRDPLGAIVSLWQPRARPGPEVIGDLGALWWHELVTVDIDEAKTFYAELLGWNCQADANGSATISTRGSCIATMREQGERNDAPANCWIPYFGAESAERARQDAEQGGGRTLTAPGDSPFGRTALLADEQGAVFGVLEPAVALSRPPSA